MQHEECQTIWHPDRRVLQHDRPIVVVGSMYMLGELHEQLLRSGVVG